MSQRRESSTNQYQPAMTTGQSGGFASSCGESADGDDDAKSIRG
jgi:hypothetical protein